MNATSLLRLLADRTAVLFLGVGAGAAIGYAFAGDIARVTNPDAIPVPTTVAPAPSPDKASLAPAAADASLDNAAIECATPFQPRLLQTVADGGRIRVGVFGDSYGDGLWAALYHQLPGRDAYEVVKFSQQSTGFTRYKSLNLEDHVTEQLSGQAIDVAVISFGANDTQGIMYDGKLAPLLSPAWKEEIGRRIDRYVRLLRQHGAIVYWVGLPVMRDPRLDADISGMNAFYADRMRSLGVPFIDTRPLSVDANGGYADYLPDPVTRTPRLMRANDGIHMSMRGYERLSAGLAGRIRRYIAAARTRAAADGLSTPAAPGASAKDAREAGV